MIRPGRLSELWWHKRNARQAGSLADQLLEKPSSSFWLAIPVILSLGIYLGIAASTFRPGFPLDDAWIHQVYARNLAHLGEWSFVPGQPSAGSTAPLWSLLLAAGYRLAVNPLVWAYLLGGIMLFLVAATGMLAFQRMSPGKERWALAAGIFLALEWHLSWAAGSGMETLLFAWLALLVLALTLRQGANPLVLGLLVGLSAWVRPDGITLAGPALLALATGEKGIQLRLRRFGAFLLGLCAFLAPYLLFNRALSGAWLPNTFFAKQVEYAVYREVPLVARYLKELTPPLTGAGALLAPAFLWRCWLAARRGEWAVLAGAAWFCGYLGIYALRLPVTYQHGRYIIPAMPVFFTWGCAGLAEVLQPQAAALWKRVAIKAWAVSTALVLAAFWLLGAKAYATDVATIESEMVDAATWLRDNTPTDALVATHDIGAVGYFSDRRLVDLAGLASPEVIPFIRDEGALGNYLDTVGADYLVTFPGWYPELVRGRMPVYQTQGEFSPAQGGENMAVYAWRKDSLRFRCDACRSPVTYAILAAETRMWAHFPDRR